MTELFLKKKGDPNIFSECDSKLTPVHIACIYGRTNIVKMLLNHNGDINLKCNEGHTPIIYAMQENHYEVISIIKNYIFEQKIEKKKKELAQRSQPKTPKNEYKDGGTPVKNTLTAIQSIEERQFTPNRINYNFDVTSPYYINITHRRHKTSRNYNESIEKTEEENCSEQQNLFELTEENVKAFSRLMSNPIVVERIAIHKRKSYIAAWRDKIQQIQKDDYSYINYLNECNDKTLLSRKSSSNETFKDASTSDSFMTAISDLNRNINAITNLAPQKSADYIENYEEDYIHSDLENGIVLYEKKMISKSRENLNRIKECAISDSSLSTTALSIPPLDYDTDTLRKELKSFGQNTGPITKTTKKLYLKKLVKFKKYPQRHIAPPQEDNSRCK